MKKTNLPLFEINELIAFCLLSAAISPYLIWGIEFFLPYPAVIEELAKACIVYAAVAIPDKLTRLKLALSMGVLFSISESIFYSFNFNLTNSLNPLLAHFIFTSLLHSLTFVIITLGGFVTTNKWRWLGWCGGISIAISVHHFYNILVQ